MAKPDIQAVFITPNGTLVSDKGKTPLADKGPITGSDLVTLNFANDAAANAGGVKVGELYNNAGALRIRVA